MQRAACNAVCPAAICRLAWMQVHEVVAAKGQHLTEQQSDAFDEQLEKALQRGDM